MPQYKKSLKTSTKGAAKSRTRRVAQSSRTSSAQELDSVFFLKLVLYVIVGSTWIKVVHNNTVNLPLPFGLAVGLLFTSHEHFQIDRKIEYAVLLIAMLVGYFAPFGLYINF